MNKYIIELGPASCGKCMYVATWEGDPGRTFIPSSSKFFATKELAEKHLKRLIKINYHRDFSQAKILDYNEIKIHNKEQK